MKWFNVDIEQLPEEGEECLVNSEILKGSTVLYAIYKGSKFIDPNSGYSFSGITHWAKWPVFPGAIRTVEIKGTFTLD